MVHKEPSEGKKRKPRGRPFTSEYNPARKPKNAFLATARRERRDGGEDIDQHEESLKEGPLKVEIASPNPMEPGKIVEITNETAKMNKKIRRNVEVVEGKTIVNEEIPMDVKPEGEEVSDTLEVMKMDEMEIPVQEEKKTPIHDEQLVDQIEFKNGTNTLKIVFKKKHNRMFRIQIFMNETTEIRPVTYTGSLTANAFWNLLKGSLKKD